MTTESGGAPRCRDDLAAFGRETLVPGKLTKARIEALRGPGPALVLKDLTPQHRWVRVLFGRPALRREERMLRALEGVEGIPRFVARLDRDAIVMEFVPGEPLRGVLGPDRTRAAALDLAAKVAALHDRGVVHLDLRQRRNILVDPAGRVHLIDFESAWRLPTEGPLRFLFRWLRRLDEGAVLKFKSKYAADLLTPAERTRARRARFLGQLWVFHRLTPLFQFLLGGRRRQEKAE